MFVGTGRARSGRSLCLQAPPPAQLNTNFFHTQKSVTLRAIITQESRWRCDAPLAAFPRSHLCAWMCCGARSVVFDLFSACVCVWVWVCESCSHGCGRSRPARASVWTNFGKSCSVFVCYLKDFDWVCVISGLLLLELSVMCVCVTLELSMSSQITFIYRVFNNIDGFKAALQW